MSKKVTLQLERLEERLLLDGSISAKLRGSTLKITGNNGDNEFEVIGIDDGIVEVVALNGTKLNGEVDGTLEFGGGKKLVKNIKIKAAGGQDDVFIEDVVIGGDLNVDLGDGADVLAIEFSEIGDDLKILGRRGYDTVSVTDTGIKDDVDVDLDDGGSFTKFANNMVGDDFDFDSDGGQDDLKFADNLVKDDVDIDTGDGKDSVCAAGNGIGDDLSVDGGDGFDTLFSDEFSNDVGDRVRIRDFEDIAPPDCGEEAMPADG